MFVYCYISCCLATGRVHPPEATTAVRHLSIQRATHVGVVGGASVRDCLRGAPWITVFNWRFS